MELNPVQQAMLSLVYSSREAALHLAQSIVRTTVDGLGNTVKDVDDSHRRDFHTIQIRTPMRLGKTYFLIDFIEKESKKLLETNSTNRILFLGYQGSIELYNTECRERGSKSMQEKWPNVDYKAIHSSADYGRACSVTMQDVLHMPDYSWIIFEDSTWLAGKDIHLEKLIHAFCKPSMLDQFVLCVG